MKHYSVMLNEAIDGLYIKSNGIYVDCTLGYGGHSSEILKKLTTGYLYCFDQDEEAIKYSRERLKKIGRRFTIIHSNFVDLKKKLKEQKISKVDGILFDLGLSSPQIDDINRGFTFMHDAPLDMRMDLNNKLDAKKVVNTYSIEELTNIFFLYGEEKMSKMIAKKIVATRLEKEINTTTELVKVIESAVGAKYFNKNHPERQIFQAIRIEVNSELTVLNQVLPDAIDLLNPGGRICVITFHSLEDRIVKQIFKKESEIDDLVKGLPEIPEKYLPKLKLINKKPILPSESEINENSRSKSAKLRIVERIWCDMANKQIKKQRKFLRLLRGERAIYFTLALIALAIPVCNVYTKAILSESNIALEEKKSEIRKQEDINDSLKMEISELASLDTIQDVATEYGLTYQNENIKVVTND